MLPTFPLFYAAVDVASSPITNWKEEVVGLEQGSLDTPPDSKSDHGGDEEDGLAAQARARLAAQPRERRASPHRRGGAPPRIRSQAAGSPAQASQVASASQARLSSSAGAKAPRA